MTRAIFGLLVMAMLSLTPVAAQDRTVTCGAVLDAPGTYRLAGDLSCPMFPPGPFCDAPVVTIAAPNVRIEGGGFTLSGNAGIGIRIEAPGAIVRDLSIDGFRIGVQIRGAGGSQVMNVTTRAGSFGCDDRGTGVELTDTSDNVITASDLSNSIDWGVRLVNAQRNRIVNNRIVDNRFRPGDPAANILLISSDDNQIIGNDLSRAGLWGLNLDSSNRNMILGNVLDETGTGNSFSIGILLSDSSENILASNSLTRVAVPFSLHAGLVLSGSASDNLIMSNRVVSHTDSGFRVSAGASDNRFYFNEGADNTVWDAEDQNEDCGTNTWKANSFGTVSQPCIDAWLTRVFR